MDEDDTGWRVDWAGLSARNGVEVGEQKPGGAGSIAGLELQVDVGGEGWVGADYLQEPQPPEQQEQDPQPPEQLQPASQVQQQQHPQPEELAAVLGVALAAPESASRAAAAQTRERAFFMGDPFAGRGGERPRRRVMSSDESRGLTARSGEERRPQQAGAWTSERQGRAKGIFRWCGRRGWRGVERGAREPGARAAEWRRAAW